MLFRSVLRLPYVVSWQTPMFDPNGTEVEADSTEKDLVNNLSDPLQVDYFMGRVFEIFTILSEDVPVACIEGTAYPVLGPSIAAGYWKILNQTKLRLTASWGTKMIRDFIPWPAAFDVWTRSIPCPHEMASGAHYIAQVKCGSEDVDDAQCFAQISIVGSREVKS